MNNNLLSEWVYVEHDSRYPIAARQVSGGRIALLGELVRAVGTLAGTVTSTGGVEIDGQECAVELVRGDTLPAVGEQVRFTFWPTLPAEPSKRIRKTPVLPALRIKRISKAISSCGDVGFVEIVGKLTRLFKDGCLVEIPARYGVVYYVPVHGKVYTDELGKWLCILAKWEAGKVVLVESTPIAWVDYFRQGQPPESERQPAEVKVAAANRPQGEAMAAEAVVSE